MFFTHWKLLNMVQTIYQFVAYIYNVYIYIFVCFSHAYHYEKTHPQEWCRSPSSHGAVSKVMVPSFIMQSRPSLETKGLGDPPQFKKRPNIVHCVFSFFFFARMLFWSTAISELQSKNIKPIGPDCTWDVSALGFDWRMAMVDLSVWPVAGGRWPVAGGRCPVSGGRWPVAGGRWLMAGGRRPVAGGRWPVAGGRWLVAGGWWPVAGVRWPVAGGWWPVAGGRWPVAGGRCPMAGGRWPVRIHDFLWPVAIA